MKLGDLRLEWSNDSGRILSFLKEVDADFYEALSSRVDLFDYAQKLSDKANNIYLVKNKQDIAHIAFYEDKQNKSIFITSISIEASHQGKGIGSFLIKAVENYARENDYSAISLEVDSRSESLIRFYKKNEFIEQSKNGYKLCLKHELN